MNVSMAKWLEIVRFELFYQFRRKSTWILFAIFLFPLLGETNGQVLEAREQGMLFGAPLFIAGSSIGMGLILILVMAAITGDAATRDVETRMEPLMHAAPIGRAAYLGGRFFGAFTMSALLLLLVPLALIGALFVHPDLGPELAGPFRSAAYLQTYFLLLLPNAFVATALMFALATRTRHILGSYAGAAIVLAAVLLGQPLIGRKLGFWKLAILLDPTGHIALDVMTDTWSPSDLKTRLVGLDGGLLSNRLVWLAIACAALAFTYVRFRYGANAGTVRWWQRGRAARARTKALDGSAIARSAPLTVPDVPRTFGAAGRTRQTLAVARDSIREMTTRWSWLVLPYFASHMIVAMRELRLRGTPVFPTTGHVLATFSALPPPFILSIFVFAILAAGELVWRERDANMQALSDAAPVPNWVGFIGKLLGLWFVIVVLRALLMLTGMVMQMRLGWYDFDPALYFKIVFGLELVGPLLFALVALSVHVLVNQKHVGHVVVLAIVMVGNLLGEWFGIEHPLLLPFAIPGWRYSEIGGFDPFTGRHLWFVLYWTAWTLFLAVVARLFWVRGVEPGIRERLRLARRRFRGWTAGAAAAALGLVLFAGGFIFYNTNILNTYRSSTEIAQRQADYERRYRRYATTPQPQLTATQLNVEIYPERREGDVRGVYQLMNRTPHAIDTIHVAVSTEVETGAIEFDRPARATLRDDDLGHHIYVLTEPLGPGDSLRMSWKVRYHPRGFPARNGSTAVIRNGSFIEMHEWMPSIGYQPGRELSDAVERKEHGLPARPDVPSLDDVRARLDPWGQERVDLDVTVGTAANQTAVAPGQLLGTWMRNSRRYFHYASPSIGPGYAIFSADYAVRKASWGDVAIEVDHHPAHPMNVDRIIRATKASLDQYTKRFGPYPYNVLRMVEYIRKDGGAHSANATIWYSEAFPLFDPAHDERRIDLPFAVIAHEVAHQFQVAPARVEGIALLSESFAWYAAMGVIEQEYGAAHLARFLDFMRRDYLDPRSRADVPLLRASDRFLGYRKGPFAMYALREYIGQEKVDLAWRRLIAQHASHEPPFATSLDLLHELEQVTPASLRPLLGDLLERNTFWELKSSHAKAQAIANGAWQVSLDVVAKKVVVDTAGVETNIPMNDLIEIGVFAPLEAGEDRGKPLYLAMHRIRTGPQTITITVPRRPAVAGIDPRHLLIDVEPNDNLADIPNPSPSKG
ncbi:MAG: type transport system permease protein [Thermoanaerobaculia bacterium]|nr:type transport system permease protein [Thermoanaerobaculia bacterium]